MKHWKLERDSDGIAWLTFDKAASSTNTISSEVFDELHTVLVELGAAPPKGLVIRSGKENGFIAGADIEQFEQLNTVEDAIALVRRAR
jgi:3-hydroxyacyl-CoA dehydrogenase/enoyl-CoA hydratase/3-hydroxybutyryl-CoA epimerase